MPLSVPWAFDATAPAPAPLDATADDDRGLALFASLSDLDPYHSLSLFFSRNLVDRLNNNNNDHGPRTHPSTCLTRSTPFHRSRPTSRPTRLLSNMPQPAKASTLEELADR